MGKTEMNDVPLRASRLRGAEGRPMGPPMAKTGVGSLAIRILDGGLWTRLVVAWFDCAGKVGATTGCGCSKSNSPSWANCLSRSSANEAAISFCDNRACKVEAEALFYASGTKTKSSSNHTCNSWSLTPDGDDRPGGQDKLLV